MSRHSQSLNYTLTWNLPMRNNLLKTPEDTTWVQKKTNEYPISPLKPPPHKPQPNRLVDTVIDQSLIVKSYSATRFGCVLLINLCPHGL